jgi:quercetin 2,3-dioxygenase
MVKVTRLRPCDRSASTNQWFEPSATPSTLEMVLEIRRDQEIHAEDGGWFHARWHFSFDRYRDPEQMGVGPLRVFNHDRLVPGAVWPLHPHADVEGITYVWKGSFRHEDSLGNDGVLGPGGVQLMTLGSGALHSEQNASKTEPMEFLQLWILPDTAALPPAVQQRQFTRDQRADRLLQVISPQGGQTIKVHQDASVYVAAVTAGTEVSHQFGPARGGYLYLIEGRAAVGEHQIQGGDAVKIFEQPQLGIAAVADSELILVDVPLRFTPLGVWARR